MQVNRIAFMCLSFTKVFKKRKRVDYPSGSFYLLSACCESYPFAGLRSICRMA
jgi:hypothetical protein